MMGFISILIGCWCLLENTIGKRIDANMKYLNEKNKK